jgi:hypothetical protein
MRRFLIAASFAFFVAAPTPARADVVYEEVTNLDDLPIDAPYPVFALDLGTNSVRGHISFSSDAVRSLRGDWPGQGS